MKIKRARVFYRKYAVKEFDLILNMTNFHFRIAFCLLLLLWFPLPSLPQNKPDEVSERRTRAINDIFKQFNHADAPGYAHKIYDLFVEAKK